VLAVIGTLESMLAVRDHHPEAAPNATGRRRRTGVALGLANTDQRPDRRAAADGVAVAGDATTGYQAWPAPAWSRWPRLP
jgi:hypothetical protein